MSPKKMIALTGTLLVLAAGLVMAQEQKAGEPYGARVRARVQTQSGNQAQTQAQTRARARVRTQFMDQNGDGINDLYRDHDNDGVPNCQDPEWTRPRDGSGYQGGQGNAGIRAGNRKGSPGNPGFSNRSFRNAQSVTGTSRPGCDGTGPKGKSARRGRG